LDAEILVEVYCELSGGRQRSLLLGDAPGEADVRVVAIASRSPRALRISLIEHAEANAHAHYIESFGRDAVWFRYMPQPA
jgi:DNA polymerase III subunit epsilon